MRAFGIGISVGVIAALLWVIESARRAASADRAGASLWPRPDGSARSYGEVWDIPA